MLSKPQPLHIYIYYYYFTHISFHLIKFINHKTLLYLLFDRSLRSNPLHLVVKFEFVGSSVEIKDDLSHENDGRIFIINRILVPDIETVRLTIFFSLTATLKKAT